MKALLFVAALSLGNQARYHIGPSQAFSLSISGYFFSLLLFVFISLETEKVSTGFAAFLTKCQ